MAVSPQRLTIYLYIAHRAVIFVIAQLSCYTVVLLTPVGSVFSRQLSQTVFPSLVDNVTVMVL